MAETFKAGDVVTLKSGGPNMTVQNADEDPIGRLCVTCVWFDGKAMKQHDFSPDALEPARNDPLPSEAV